MAPLNALCMSPACVQATFRLRSWVSPFNSSVKATLSSLTCPALSGRNGELRKRVRPATAKNDNQAITAPYSSFSGYGTLPQLQEDHPPCERLAEISIVPDRPASP